MLKKVKLMSFINKVVDHPEWINEHLYDYKIITVGFHKELVLIYKLFDLQMVCNLNHAIKYENAFVKQEYKKEFVWLYFMIPDCYYYTIEFLEDRVPNSFTKNELKSLELFCTKKPELSF